MISDDYYSSFRKSYYSRVLFFCVLSCLIMFSELPLELISITKSFNSRWCDRATFSHSSYPQSFDRAVMYDGSEKQSDFILACLEKSSAQWLAIAELAPLPAKMSFASFVRVSNIFSFSLEIS